MSLFKLGSDDGLQSIWDLCGVRKGILLKTIIKISMLRNIFVQTPNEWHFHVKV